MGSGGGGLKGGFGGGGIYIEALNLLKIDGCLDSSGLGFDDSNNNTDELYSNGGGSGGSI